MSLRRFIKRINSRVDSVIAPPSKNRRQLYKKWLMDADFDTALHLGSGRDRHRLGQQLESKGQVVALDPDTSGLNQNITDRKVVGDGQRLPFRNNTFDLVFSEYVFEHLPDPKSALNEIDRVLKPGGSFVVLVPNPRHYYAKIADITPFWFHQLWFRLQGVEDHEEDRFPTQYEWGTLSDITNVDRWELENFESFSGPTGYTTVLPVHILFTMFDRTMANKPKYHVCYLAQYRVPT